MRRRIDATTPIVVLKMTRSLVQHGVLGIARSAGRLGINVHWVHNCEHGPAAASRYVTRAHRLGQSGDGAGPWLALLVGVAEQCGSRALLIPTDDPSAALVAEHAAALEPWYRVRSPGAHLTQRLSNKRRLHELCLATGVPTPAARFPRAVDDLERYAASGPFPVALKRIDGTTLERTRTLPSVTILRAPDELRRLAAAVRDADVANMMLQEHVPGDPRSVWMFEGYFDAASRCTTAFTGRKVRQHPAATGMTSLGVCEHNPEVIATTERLMSDLGYRGPVDIGFRLDRRDGSYKLLDVNPRIGATFRLFVDAAGTDILRAMYLDVTGQPMPPRLPVVEGRRWLVEHTDVLTAAELRRTGALSARAWLGSLRGVRETAWLAPDDPVPAVALAGALLRQRRDARRAARGAGPYAAGSDALPVSVGAPRK